MASTKDGMHPWFPFLFSPGDLRSGAVNQELHVLPVKDLRSETGGHVSFDSEPLIGEISHRSIDADGTRIEDRGSEPYPIGANRKLPPKIVTPAIDELWIGGRGRRRSWIGRGASERKCGSQAGNWSKRASSGRLKRVCACSCRHRKFRRHIAVHGLAIRHSFLCASGAPRPEHQKYDNELPLHDSPLRGMTPRLESSHSATVNKTIGLCLRSFASLVKEKRGREGCPTWQV